MKTKLALILAIARLSFAAAQGDAGLYTKGVQCRKERDYVNGYRIFTRLLKSDSLNAEYLANASFFTTKYGFYFAGAAEKESVYKRAADLASRAVDRAPQYSDAHYVYALALGHSSLLSGVGTKLNNAKLIKRELETAIRLDSRHAGAYHMLGRWHAAIAGLGYFQRMAVSCVSDNIIGEASLEASARCLTQATKLEPGFKMHFVALAEVYFEMDLEGMAASSLQKADAIRTWCLDDKVADQMSKSLWKKLN
jgi:regulator of microtubule dynamics protein 3